MAGVNFAVLVGNVGQDPEFARTHAGKKVGRFTLATNETWRDRDSGERKERVEWHRVVVWNEGLVGVVEQYVKKGTKLFIKGTLKTRSWEDQAGSTRYTTEIHLSGFNAQMVLLDSKGSGRTPMPDDGDAPGFAEPGSAGVGPGSGSVSQDLDDEVPF